MKAPVDFAILIVSGVMCGTFVYSLLAGENLLASIYAGCWFVTGVAAIVTMFKD